MTAAPTSTPTTEQQRQLFDILAIVAYLKSIGADGATPNFARGLITSGQVAHIRVGRKYYVSRAALDRWLETQAKRSR
jgi:excisionase family DNA binding protein